MYCPHCGNELRPEDQFCPVCGKSQGRMNPTSSQLKTPSRKRIFFAISAILFLGLAGLVALYMLRGREVLASTSPPPVMVSALEVATVEPAEVLPVTLNLTPAGGHGYPGLEEALADVPPGSTINLAVGTYILSEPVTVDKPLTLIGAGMENTVISGSDAAHVIRFNGDGPFHLEGIHFQHEGEEVADVVVVNGGEVRVADCSFTGAFSGDDPEAYAGLWLTGNTTGTVLNSVSQGNDTAGFIINSDADVSLAGNTASDNTQMGIMFLGRATGTAEQNICINNGQYGFYINEESAPVLSDNRSSGNGYSGVFVRGEARPQIISNEIYENAEAGIVFQELAAGTATENISHHNGLSGFIISGSASPDLLGNQAHSNSQSGIAYLENGGGTAVGNICFGNTFSGIGVQGDAAPVLEANELRDNAQSGLFFADDSSGVARANSISGNSYYCIHVFEQAAPTLAGNACEGNAYEIVVEDTASPTLRDNVESAAPVASGGSGAQWISGDARYADDPPMIIAYANTRYVSPASGISVRDSGGEFWRMNEWVALMNGGDWIEATHAGTAITSAGVQFWGDNDDGLARVLVDGVERWVGSVYGENGNYPGGAFVNYLYFTDLGSGPHTIRVEAVGEETMGVGDNVTVMFFGFE
ncbi:MAG: right-handed parallel beta-helix repeat-containing protein [Anaerolineales bacterium]|nr:right-handed parallel beta-helix repeat-containing protein [Anaerolineales bacterium]